MFFATAVVNAQVITQNFGTGANAFSIDFVQIGNPGNAADSNGIGFVPYTYNLGKYEISRDQINKANAAANAVGGAAISILDMTNYGGNGVNRPATGISWNEAARFVNYLNTSQGYQAAYNFTTALANDPITLWEAGQYIGTNQYRHKDAYYFLPSHDEWYKGAYGSPTGDWYLYANGSNSPPIAVSGGTDASTAVYGQRVSQGPADVMDAGGLSPYGTMAQNGNVWEWTESPVYFDNNWRVELGGGWSSDIITASTVQYGGNGPSTQSIVDGFRVASVPEPSALSLLAVGLGALAILRRRRS